MKKRTGCQICLFLLIIKIIFLIITGIDLKVPDYSKDPPAVLAGVVYQKENKSEYQILYLKNVEFPQQKQSNQKLKIILYDQKFHKVSIGNLIQVKGKTEVLEEAPNPGNFDQKFYYEKQGITLKMKADDIKILSGTVQWPKEILYRFRMKWHQFLIDALGEKRGGILSAMMLGEKRDLSPDVKELYQVSGIGHILAISGLHLSFLGEAVYTLLKKAGCSYKVSAPISSLILTVYVGMTGFHVSSTRAWIMFLIRMGAELCGRVYDPYTSLMIAAVLIVYKNPLFLCDAGFYLSFGAVFAILRVYPVIRKLYPGTNRIVESFLAGSAITLFLLPVTLTYFFEVPIYSFLWNLIVIPLLPFLLGIGFFASFLALFYADAAFLVIQADAFIFALYEKICQVNLCLPFHKIVTGKPSVTQIFVYYAGFFLLLFLMEKKRKKAVWFYLIFLWILIPQEKDQGLLTIQMIDVGQGDGIFMKSPNGTTYLIDGGSVTVKEVGKHRIEPFLKSQKVKELDYVFISHGDQDHFNGVEEMMRRQRMGIRIRTLVMPPKNVWNPALIHLVHTAKETGVKVVAITEKEGIKEGLFSLTCLFPDEEGEWEAGNESSMVLYVDYRKFQMLFTGDLEGEGEEALKKKKIGEIEVLKVAHHGSRNSTDEEILQKLRPKIGLISAGKGNSYGHPHKETMERLKKYGVKTKVTMNGGCISIVTDGERIKIKQ